MEERIAGDWAEAVALARSHDAETEVRLSKAVGPTLPADLDVRRSNFPWSIHEGARAVYQREPASTSRFGSTPPPGSSPPTHYNPRARPLGHAAVDVPAMMLIAMATLTPVRSHRWVFGDRLPSPADTFSFTAATVDKGATLGRDLIPLA